MDRELQRRVQRLKEDYESVSGRAWEHFFCPILYKDEKADLSHGHIINRALPNSDRSWVPQRTDIDSWFGTHFEADFLLLSQIKRHSIEELLTDSKLARKFRPKIYLDSEVIEHYIVRSRVPNDFSEAAIDDRDDVRLALKRSPQEIVDSLDGRWQIGVEHDLKLPAMVSVLKAAHLSLFYLLGYIYTLSRAGRYLGYTTLGRLFLQARGLGKDAVQEMAQRHLASVTNMVQAVQPGSSSAWGTVTDGLINFCVDKERHWAYQVFIRMADQLFVVMVPTLHDTECESLFRSFLRSPESEIEFHTRRWRQKYWEADGRLHTMRWPGWGF